MDFEELNKAASQEDGPTRIDRALDKFANMMIERLEACKTKGSPVKVCGLGIDLH